MSVYDACLEQSNNNGDALLECISTALQTGQVANSTNVNTWFLIFAAALVFFMQAGFAMLCAGSVRIKNVQNTMLKNLLDTCGAAIAFFMVGYAFAFGGQDTTTGTTFIGTENFFMYNIPSYSFWLFQFAFAATSATIVAGTLAERCQMVTIVVHLSSLCSSTLLFKSASSQFAFYLHCTKY